MNPPNLEVNKFGAQELDFQGISMPCSIGKMYWCLKKIEAGQAGKVVQMGHATAVICPGLV